MAQHHNGAIRNESLLRPGPITLRLFDVKSTYDIGKHIVSQLVQK